MRKLGPFLCLVVGVAFLIALTKLGPHQGVEMAMPLSGYEVMHHPHGTFVVRGQVELLEPGRSQGTILRIRATDETPLQVWVGPDVTLPVLNPRDWVAVTARANGSLLVASALEREQALSERETYPVAQVAGGFAWVNTGLGPMRFPVPEGWHGETLTVSRYGDKTVVE